MKNKTNVTLHQIIDRYLEEKQVHNPATVSNCNKIAAFFGDVDIGTISEKMVLDYIQSRRLIAKPATINRELTVIKQIFKQAHRQGLIPTNPVTFVGYEKLSNMRDRWITPEEESLLVSNAYDWLKPIIPFATSTGMRRREILNLRSEAINTQTRTLTLTSTKNGVNRAIPLTDRAFKSIPPDCNGYVFQRDGKRIDESALEYAFKKACRLAGIKDLHFHDMRHTAASRWVQGGVDLYIVQRLLGHKNPIMTQRYAHHSVESLRKAIENVPGL